MQELGYREFVEVHEARVEAEVKVQEDEVMVAAQEEVETRQNPIDGEPCVAVRSEEAGVESTEVLNVEGMVDGGVVGGTASEDKGGNGLGEDNVEEVHGRSSSREVDPADEGVGSNDGKCYSICWLI